jgi:hypothetical protein
MAVANGDTSSVHYRSTFTRGLYDESVSTKSPTVPAAACVKLIDLLRELLGNTHHIHIYDAWPLFRNSHLRVFSSYGTISRRNVTLVCKKLIHKSIETS